MSRIVKNAASSILAVLCFAIVPTFAQAACGNYGAPGLKAAIKLPGIAHADLDSPDRNQSIVGLWHVIYTAPDNSVFNDTFDSWHADGTETESAFFAPASGNVCMGVWKQLGAGMVRLHHIGWLFDPSNPTANATNYFTLDEQNTVAPDGKTYTGTFTFKVWNLDGTPTTVDVSGTPTQKEVQGTIAATRITVE